MNGGPRGFVRVLAEARDPGGRLRWVQVRLEPGGPTLEGDPAALRREHGRPHLTAALAALARGLHEIPGRPGRPGLRLGPAAPAVMGILNLTPDSFSDGGSFADVEAAVAAGLVMVEEGAAILDLGAESTRPGAAEVPVEEELARLLPVLARLRPATDAVLSVDTRKAAVASAALELGADWINDVSCLRHDPDLAGVAAGAGAALVLMHSRAEPATMQRAPAFADCLAEVVTELREAADRALAAGVRPEALLLDPGIGFGKRHEDNLALLHGLPTLRALGHPVLLGLSRKSLCGRLLDEQDPPPPAERDLATLALTAWTHAKGVSVHRVHRPGYAVTALRVLRATGSGFPQAPSTAAGDEST